MTPAQADESLYAKTCITLSSFYRYPIREITRSNIVGKYWYQHTHPAFFGQLTRTDPEAKLLRQKSLLPRPRSERTSTWVWEV